MTSIRMPIVFFGHGSPVIALETNAVTRTWFEMARAMPRPKAILCISAHWLTQGTAVTAMAQPATIHDFGGFSEEMFAIRYPAPGDPALAARVRDLLAPTPVALDIEQWGFDHGAWTVLMKAYPQADIPVVQLSMDYTKSAQWHYEQGRKLRPLREEGVLIVGTGNTVHNISAMSRSDRHGPPHSWAAAFSDAVRDAVVDDDPFAVVQHSDKTAFSKLAQPTPDHYWPLLYVLGAREPDDRVSVPVDHIEYKSIGMTSFLIEPAPAA